MHSTGNVVDKLAVGMRATLHCHAREFSVGNAMEDAHGNDDHKFQMIIRNKNILHLDYLITYIQIVQW